MSANLAPDLEDRLVSEVIKSLERGKAVRRNNILWSTLILFVLIVALAIFDVPMAFVVSITVAVASLCLIWAVMSASASMNSQFDQLVEIIIHYAEKKSG